MEITIENETQLLQTAQSIVDFAAQEKIFLFYGQMGAGKTTLINSICKYLGVLEHTSSPTFSIVNQYQAKQNTVFHFDFYRLKTQNEALDLGYEEYFYSGAYCLVEWPEKIPDLLPPTYLKIKIEVLNNQARRFIITRH